MNSFEIHIPEEMYQELPCIRGKNMSIEKLKNKIIDLIECTPLGSQNITEKRKQKLIDTLGEKNKWINELKTTQANVLIEYLTHERCPSQWYIDGLPILGNAFFKVRTRTNELQNFNLQKAFNDAQDNKINISESINNIMRTKAVFKELFATGNVFYDTLDAYKEWQVALNYIKHILTIDSITTTRIEYIKKDGKVGFKLSTEYTFTIQYVANKQLQNKEKFYKVSDTDFRQFFIDGNFDAIKKYKQ